MKTCEFDGWMELEWSSDIIKQGDVIISKSNFDKGMVPDTSDAHNNVFERGNGCIGQIPGSIYGISEGWRCFRKIPGPYKPRKLRLNELHSEPVPLP